MNAETCAESVTDSSRRRALKESESRRRLQEQSTQSDSETRQHDQLLPCSAQQPLARALNQGEALALPEEREDTAQPDLFGLFVTIFQRSCLDRRLIISGLITTVISLILN